ncbi:uncharacterized protein C6C3.02c-like isoform X2 [Salvia splendens]|uniref:uncharacterized protein C6C3.02c-like isoform X2 n=1 Tax=Salvia splendens TaxID=180675 RepID=UPI001C25F99C|nr:uncharacterized protein C6C3.02c-like isoform X2 [Salvia splendens]
MRMRAESPSRSKMARRSSGRSSRPAARSPPPQKVNRAPPPAPVQGGSGGSMLGSTIAQGMAFGTGSAMAHRAVDAVMGPRTIQHETVASEALAAPASEACSPHNKAFQDNVLPSLLRTSTSSCAIFSADSHGSDITKCQFYMNMLAECRRNSGSNSMMSS